jgi:DNA replication protein DnaC
MQTSESDKKPFEWQFQASEPCQVKALAEAKKFCSEMASGSWGKWLTLAGSSGNGKTLLAKDIREWFKAHVMGRQYIHATGSITSADYRFRTWSRCLSQIYAGEYGVVSDLSDEYLAIIDDIGAEHDPRKLGVSKLLDILNRRQRRFTVLTTNLLPQDIATELDTRIASRLIRNGSVVVTMDAVDWNLRKVKQ